MTPTIRIWPGIIILLTMLSLMTLPGIYFTNTMLHFMSLMAAPFLCTFASCIWWVGFSRGVPRRDRWITVALVILCSVLASLPTVIIHLQPPLRTFMPPLNILLYGLAVLVALWVTWIAITFMMHVRVRVLGVKVIVVMVLATFSVLRVDGTSAGMFPDIAVLWSERPEEKARELNDSTLVQGKPIANVLESQSPTDWPAFRGISRDGTDRVSRIETDWEKHPPKLLWKQKIGPGWGTFSVIGERLYTQEQRGPQEAVICYDASSGGQIWRYFEDTYFKETISGAGPRATPTVAYGRVYVQGTKGTLVCLDAEKGTLIWKANITEGTGGIMPTWGYSSSPLVVDNHVITYTGGPDGKGISAFDITTGKLVWSAGNAGHSYSSPQLYRHDGKTEVLFVSNVGVEAFDPTTGKAAWTHEWKFAKDINRTCQPAILPDGDIVFSMGVGNDQGMRRFSVKGDQTVLKWQSKHMRSYFNDGVVHKNHYYGFDGKSLACINLDDGSLRWNGGTKYGDGQLILLADQQILVVSGVDGTVALVDAKPDEYNEITRIKAIQGKTWNHPVVASGRLYVRNATEAAAYELPVRTMK